MQTFLPFPDFRHSAACLDRQRLGKQRVENLQLLNATTGTKVVDGILVEPFLSGGWVYHPAAKMWAANVGALFDYHIAICAEWVRRGYADTCAAKFSRHMALLIQAGQNPDRAAPSWFGDGDFHLSHQSNLLRKDSAHYGPWFPGVPDDLPYVWPVS